MTAPERKRCFFYNFRSESDPDPGSIKIPGSATERLGKGKSVLQDHLHQFILTQPEYRYRK